jgi:hypothetical protein
VLLRIALIAPVEIVVRNYYDYSNIGQKLQEKSQNFHLFCSKGKKKAEKIS